MRCVHCFSTCDRLFCSIGCAEERYSLMLEGVKLLDEVMSLVDTAAAARGAAAAAAAPPAAIAARARPAPKPARPEDIPPPPLIFRAIDGPELETLPGGIDPPGRNP